MRALVLGRMSVRETAARLGIPEGRARAGRRRDGRLSVATLGAAGTGVYAVSGWRG
ncbi:hypothetical protein JOF53_007554 [Crossiella equi]|uniref:Uncharacterized protein n=1 Tax=Crossiella equi TaxID=130796 RepID=A0ABS5AR04_9PSEU|nr:hypothetical protein [Crossiella equi]MBP2478682.1 hypothetical protein [Crossiella equi]